MKTPKAPLQQIHLGLGPHGYEPVGCFKADETNCLREHEVLESSILRVCPAHLWPKGSYRAACPRPILISKRHGQQLADLHEALTAATTDIVKRWWTDREARFPERMPLDRHEEDLLQWLESQVEQGNLQKYHACRGSWRPDFLVEDLGWEDGETVENFRITEINARFSFNGYMHEAYGQQALEDMDLKGYGLVGATDAAEVFDGLFSLFRPELPLHLLKGAETGIDIHLFIDAVQRRFGVAPRLITPADLRLRPDPEGRSGAKLCCVAGEGTAPSELIASEGETLEQIYQVGLELHQHELKALEPEVLRQISLRCFNDMRTILLVHDKRMLGIVLEELPQLVARTVLTPAQTRVLENGIADTTLPGSQRLHELLQLSRGSPEVRLDYILKPVRSGKGDGIVFGDELSADAWTSALERLRSAALVRGGTNVVQRRVNPRLYDVILKASGDVLRYPLVGTYHAVHGKLLGLGTWRSSGDRICAVSSGGTWICSVMLNN